MLHHGDIAEMKTGEGKTLTATLPVVLNTLAGKGVHLVTVNDYLAKRDAEWMTPIYEMLGLSGRHPAERRVRLGPTSATSLRGRHHVRHQLRVRLRLPARQHRAQHRREGPARPRLRDRRRGRQHPDRRGAHAADHQRPARAGRRLLQAVRQARPQMVPGEKPKEVSAKDRVWIADFDYEADEKYKTVSITELGVAKAEKFLGIENLYLAETGTPGQPPDPGAEGRVALQARHRLRGDRRRGQDHRRVHRPHPRGPPLERRSAPGRRGQGGRARSRKRTRPSPRSPTRTTSAATTSWRA